MLTIIIPTLNEEKYLPRLLTSLKKQSFQDFEIVVADAGSKDKTVEIAKNFGCRVVKGGLPPVGRNNGAKAAKGDLFLFLDADVGIPSPDFLKKTIEEFNRRKLDIAGCRISPLEKRSLLLQQTTQTLFELFNLMMLVAEKIDPLALGSMLLVKKQLHYQIGGFDEDIRLAEDIFYVRKAVKAGRFGVLKSVKIQWSLRRFKRERWIKPFLIYAFCLFLLSFNDKNKLRFFESGFFEYRFGHYGELKSLREEILPRVNALKGKLKEEIRKVLEKKNYLIR